MADDMEDKDVGLNLGRLGLTLATAVILPLLLFVVINKSAIHDDKNDLEAQSSHSINFVKEDFAWKEIRHSPHLERCRLFLARFGNGRHAVDARRCVEDFEDQEWAEAQRDNTVESYDLYRTRWPTGRYRADAQSGKEKVISKRQENIAWLNFKNSRSRQVCEIFLRDYPFSVHVSEAQSCVSDAQDDEDWHSAQQLNGLEDYERYIDRWPAGRHSGDAKLAKERLALQRQENTAWLDVKKAKTLRGCESFLRNYPSGAHVVEAQNCISEFQDDGDWETAARSNRLQDYKQYIAKWPAGRHASDASLAKEKIELQQRENITWDFLKETKTLQACQDFLRDHPAGSHVEEARKCVSELQDDSDWSDVRKSNSLGSYERYMAKWPSGRHFTEASSIRDEIRLENSSGLTWKKIQSNLNLEVCLGYLAKFSDGPYSLEAKDCTKKFQDKAYWAAALKRGRLENFIGYLKKWPSGLYAREALVLIEKKKEIAETREWQETQNKPTLLRCLNFQKAYPNSRHGLDVQSCVKIFQDKSGWQDTLRSSQIENFITYIKNVHLAKISKLQSKRYVKTVLGLPCMFPLGKSMTHT